MSESSCQTQLAMPALLCEKAGEGKGRKLIKPLKALLVIFPVATKQARSLQLITVQQAHRVSLPAVKIVP